jgi:cation diffusion facilitator CzcD-associated flavoprotein CzcO
MAAINMSHFKLKLQAISRQLFLEHGWHMPPGLACRRDKNPLNFTLAEWQQAKRRGSDAKEIKATLLECWKQSDSKNAFSHALEEHGYVLAKGDKRGFVVVD